MGHIELSRAADLIVVAPATADLLARMAHGIANDLASTTLLATDKRVLAAPAMNVRMWLHPATRRNVATLAGDGVAFVGPDEGEMACGEFGPGRMAEPLAIVGRDRAGTPATDRHSPARAAADPAGPLTGRHVIVTAGPDLSSRSILYVSSAIDPLASRDLRSRKPLSRAGARVTLISGPVALPDPPGASVVRVETASADAGSGRAQRCRPTSSSARRRSPIGGSRT